MSLKYFIINNTFPNLVIYKSKEYLIEAFRLNQWDLNEFNINEIPYFIIDGIKKENIQWVILKFIKDKNPCLLKATYFNVDNKILIEMPNNWNKDEENRNEVTKIGKSLLSLIQKDLIN